MAGDTTGEFHIRQIGYPFGILPTPKQLAEDITNMLPRVKTGTLRFWGKWFGKPYDNCHRVISCDATDDCLRIRFDEGEVLTVWDPVMVEIDARKFRIGNASAVRWTWFYYGRAQTPENLFYEDYVLQEDGVAFRTNGDQV